MTGPQPELPIPRIEWGVDGATEPAPRRRSRRRRAAVPLVVAAVLVLLATGVAVLRASGPDPAGPGVQDRYAVDAVAQRFRALGATVLADALRCAATPPGAGRTDAVTCTFGSWSLILSEYGSTADLLAARDRAVTPDPTSVRHAVTVRPDAAVAMDETGAGTVAMYWDTVVPRPMSASVSSAETSLPDLVGFYDSRGAGAAPRPDLPGPAFASGALWDFARSRVLADGPDCAPAGDRDSDYVDTVECTYPNGVVLKFFLLSTSERAAAYRTGFVDPVDTLPDLHRVGQWASVDPGGPSGTMVEYVYDDAEAEAYLYFDDLDLRCFGRMSHPDFTQEQLKAFWAEHAYREVTAGGG